MKKESLEESDAESIILVVYSKECVALANLESKRTKGMSKVTATEGSNTQSNSYPPFLKPLQDFLALSASLSSKYSTTWIDSESMVLNLRIAPKVSS